MMTTHDEVAELQLESDAARTETATRPLRSSIRRELWENRYVWIAPLIVASLVVFGTFIHVTRVPRKLAAIAASDVAKRHAAIVNDVALAPSPIIFITLLVGAFYSLEALYGERRDRSILFWKSLPVSDRTAVLAKASIPMVVLPLFGLALGVAAQLVALIGESLAFAAHGIPQSVMWREYHFATQWLVMIYGVAVHELWFAPIYAWLLLVSAWARRAPFLWATLPFIVAMIVERILFQSKYFALWLGYRFSGAMKQAFDLKHGMREHIESLSQLAPLRFLATPGLWLGLLFAAVCLAMAIRLRRHREST